jgi:hypothetical protein
LKRVHDTRAKNEEGESSGGVVKIEESKWQTGEEKDIECTRGGVKLEEGRGKKEAGEFSREGSEN